METENLSRFMAGIIMTIGLSYMACDGSSPVLSLQQSRQPISFDAARNGIAHIGIQSQNSDDLNAPNAIETWLGTGFHIDYQCTFATAKHLFVNADKNRLLIRFNNPQDPSKINTHPAKIVYEDPKSDLAFIRVESGDKRCDSTTLFLFNLISDFDKSLVGEEVLLIGYPNLASGQSVDIPVLRSGIISSTEISVDGNQMLLLDLPGGPGFSGSPVILRKDNRVIGVVFGPGPTHRMLGFEWATAITKHEYTKAVEGASRRQLPDQHRSP